MTYMPIIDLTPQVRMLLGRGALKLQPGQWLRSPKGVGRYLRTDTRKGVIYVSWTRPGDRWIDQAQRFSRACRKGFIGKYRPLYERVKAERDAGRPVRTQRSGGKHRAGGAGGHGATPPQV